MMFNLATLVLLCSNSCYAMTNHPLWGDYKYDLYTFKWTTEGDIFEQFNAYINNIDMIENNDYEFGTRCAPHTFICIWVIDFKTTLVNIFSK